MEQAVWLLCVLFLQVCLLSTTALPGQDRRTAAFQTNQAMGGSSPFLPGPPPQSSRTKRHESTKGRRKRPYRPGVLAAFSELAVPPYRSSA
ncbi:uncharacterized protein LOC116358642 isoform X2 [Oncorhynchus kisutch]|uniref:uncharacterized protein LOC116358642 isoform X2 n=1 Tax=Oncorhynchus kisutch TaxID=8019 RepID=UPI0012DF700C|nr:uncharacterized protein LOC116358642 isoform X2 [Oncorhynchus kisutch]